MATYSLFNQAAHTVANIGVNQATVGLEFSVSEAGTLEGLWLDSSSGMTALPTAIGVYNYSSQSLIASNSSPSWSGGYGTGWIYAAFTSPVSLTASTDYMAAVFGPAGCDGYDTGYSWPVTNSPLTGVNGGFYSLNSSLSFPASQQSGWNWYIDVSVSVSSSATSTVAMGFNPAMSASVSVANPVTATAAVSFAPAMSASVSVPFTASAATGFKAAMAASVSVIPPVTATVAMNYTPALSATVTAGIPSRVMSLAPKAGTDKYGYDYPAGIAVYGPGDASVQMLPSVSVDQVPEVLLTPGSSTTSNPPAVFSTAAGTGTSAERYALNLNSGYTSTGSASYESSLYFQGSAPDGTVDGYMELVVAKASGGNVSLSLTPTAATFSMPVDGTTGTFSGDISAANFTGSYAGSQAAVSTVTAPSSGTWTAAQITYLTTLASAINGIIARLQSAGVTV